MENLNREERLRMPKLGSYPDLLDEKLSKKHDHEIRVIGVAFSASIIILRIISKPVVCIIKRRIATAHGSD